MQSASPLVCKLSVGITNFTYLFRVFMSAYRTYILKYFGILTIVTKTMSTFWAYINRITLVSITTTHTHCILY